jgi:hypothetical protein
MKDCLDLSEWRQKQNGHASDRFECVLPFPVGKGRGEGIRLLAKHHLRPAGQTGGHGAKIIAPGNRNAR